MRRYLDYVDRDDIALDLVYDPVLYAQPRRILPLAFSLQFFVVESRKLLQLVGTVPKNGVHTRFMKGLSTVRSEGCLASRKKIIWVGACELQTHGEVGDDKDL
jgi:hypothetical protein